VCPGSADLGLAGKCVQTELPSKAIGVNPIGLYIGGQENLHPYSHFEVFLPSAGGSGAVPGDYLFRDYQSTANLCGQWGLLRVQ
jgi:hypothetical protein